MWAVWYNQQQNYEQSNEQMDSCSCTVETIQRSVGVVEPLDVIRSVNVEVEGVDNGVCRCVGCVVQPSVELRTVQRTDG